MGKGKDRTTVEKLKTNLLSAGMSTLKISKEHGGDHREIKKAVENINKLGI